MLSAAKSPAFPPSTGEDWNSEASQGWSYQFARKNQSSEARTRSQAHIWGGSEDWRLVLLREPVHMVERAEAGEGGDPG